MWGRGLGCFVLVWASGCIIPGQFQCDGDAECSDGRCVVGDCVHPDLSCPSNERYSIYAGPGVAGQCFEPAAPSTTTGTTMPATASVTTVQPVTSTTEPSSAAGSSESTAAVSAESSGEPVVWEECNGIDDNDNGLVDEWSPINRACDICVSEENCKPCDLFPDDEANPTRVYYFCHSANWNQYIPFCTDLNAPAASVHDDDENLLLTLKVTEFAMYARAQIGLRNFGTQAAPSWAWADTSPFMFHRLGALVDDPMTSEPCVHLVTSGDWEVQGCNSGAPFICEAPLP